MPKFCGSCGAARGAGRFCGACGAPFDEASPPRALANPFAGVPLSDYVRDLLAAASLLAVLGLTWDVSFGDMSYGAESGANHWWVVVSVLLAVAALGVPYVVRSQVVPGLHALHSHVTKTALTLPLLGSVVAAVVHHLIHAGNPFEAAIGLGVSFALFGAVLTLLPRTADAMPGSAHALFWGAAGPAAVIAVCAGLVLYVARVIGDLVGDGMAFEEPLLFALDLISGPVTLVALLGVAAVKSLDGGVWRRVFAAVSVGSMGAVLVSRIGDDGSRNVVHGLGAETWDMPGAGFFFIAAAAAFSLSPVAQQRTKASVEAASGWVLTAHAALAVSSIALLLAALAIVLLDITVEVDDLPFTDGFTASSVVVTVLLVFAALLGLLARAMFSAIEDRRTVALGLVLGQMVLAAVAMIVSVTQGVPTTGMWVVPDMGLVLVTGLSALGAGAVFGGGVLALYALTVPGAVREALGPLFPPPGTSQEDVRVPA